MPLMRLPRKAPTPLVITMNTPLGACPDPGIALRFDVQGAGDVEEIERHAIDDARGDDHPQAAGRIAVGEKAKPKHPGDHAENHDPLYAEPSQEKRDGKDEERF